MKLIWAAERQHPDTGQPIPDPRNQTSVSDRGYGPVQGTRLVRLNKAEPPHGARNAVICVRTNDLWQETPNGLERAEL
jgi:hypothetical protein